MTRVALIVRSRRDKTFQHRVELARLDEAFVQQTELRLLCDMNVEDYYIDDHEVVLAMMGGMNRNPRPTAPE